MRVLVTGGAGFLGSHLVDKLMSSGYNVTVVDNLSSGSLKNIKNWINNSRFKFVNEDLKKYGGWVEELKNIDIVFHYAANPEVKVSVTDPKIHFEENLKVTFNILEACRHFKVPFLVFPSTSTVYGDAKTIPTPEDYYPLKPISIYGATKLSCEILVETYTKLYSLKSLILRYANIIGPRMGHGVIVDFIRKLKSNPEKLEILGDGLQKKSYLHIDDAVEATLKALNHILNSEKPVEVFNIGSEDWISVKEIADMVVKALGLKNVNYLYQPATNNGRGWIGDVKLMLLDINKLKTTTNWKPKMGSKEALWKTLENLNLKAKTT